MDIRVLTQFAWKWPLPLLIIIVGGAISLFFNFVQIRGFVASLRHVLMPKKAETQEGKQSISPLQAFLTTLSATLGNGSLAGMAIAMFYGGPGAALWLMVFGLFAMPIRFAEVFASGVFTAKTPQGTRGGPMIYLGLVPGGTILPYLYTVFCIFLCLVNANMMQCNSMAGGLTELTGVRPHWFALIFFVFLVYVLFGGAQRIIRFSEVAAPLKVILFLGATGAVLIYFYAQLWGALVLIWKAAFSVKAAAGGFAGHTMQNAFRHGIAKVTNATESGLGSASVMFGATGGKHPVESGVMSMALVFVTQIICFLIMLAFIVSGVWNSGLEGMPMVMAAYASVFGVVGSWIAIILSTLFGIGCLVGYSYIGRECWLFLTKGRWEWVFLLIFCLMAPLGTLSGVKMVWDLVDLVNAGLIVFNLYGILWLLPSMRRIWREKYHGIIS